MHAMVDLELARVAGCEWADAAEPNEVGAVEALAADKSRRLRLLDDLPPRDGDKDRWWALAMKVAPSSVSRCDPLVAVAWTEGVCTRAAERRAEARGKKLCAEMTASCPRLGLWQAEAPPGESDDTEGVPRVYLTAAAAKRPR
jgi:hypothetical protein